MKEYIYKQYVVLVTKWKYDVLFRARIRLTASYIVVATAILAVFSYLLYRALLVSLTDSIRDLPLNIIDSARLYNDTADAIQSQIFFVDGTTLLIVLVGGYILTIVTLRPIREARNREKRFLADAAHEFRTPLAVMKSGTEVVLRGEKNLSPRIKKILTDNIDEIDSLTKIANGLLTFVSEKEMNINHRATLCVGEVLERVVQKLTPLAEKKHITFLYQQHEKALQTYIRADQSTLNRVFENIIHNAIKYTSEEGSITIRETFSKNLVNILVHDTGIGIPQKDLAHVTEPFFRADISRTETEGSGLGLSIVSETIKALGGTLHIESEHGVGTTVNITLPVFST